MSYVLLGRNWETLGSKTQKNKIERNVKNSTEQQFAKLQILKVWLGKDAGRKRLSENEFETTVSPKCFQTIYSKQFWAPSATESFSSALLPGLTLVNYWTCPCCRVDFFSLRSQGFVKIFWCFVTSEPVGEGNSGSISPMWHASVFIALQLTLPTRINLTLTKQTSTKHRSQEKLNYNSNKQSTGHRQNGSKILRSRLPEASCGHLGFKNIQDASRTALPSTTNRSSIDLKTDHFIFSKHSLSCLNPSDQSNIYPDLICKCGKKFGTNLEQLWSLLLCKSQQNKNNQH